MRRRNPDLYERADAAIAAGKLWRAREILQGNIALHGYDQHLFERYGQVLLQLGDAMEAGKYLFLSGDRKHSLASASSSIGLAGTGSADGSSLPPERVGAPGRA